MPCSILLYCPSISGPFCLFIGISLAFNTIYSIKKRVSALSLSLSQFFYFLLFYVFSISRFSSLGFFFFLSQARFQYFFSNWLTIDSNINRIQPAAESSNKTTLPLWDLQQTKTTSNEKCSSVLKPKHWYFSAHLQ